MTYNPETDWRANYWKVEAREHGDLKGANIDRLNPTPEMVRFMIDTGEI